EWQFTAAAAAAPANIVATKNGTLLAKVAMGSSQGDAYDSRPNRRDGFGSALCSVCRDGADAGPRYGQAGGQSFRQVGPGGFSWVRIGRLSERSGCLQARVWHGGFERRRPHYTGHGVSRGVDVQAVYSRSNCAAGAAREAFAGRRRKEIHS